MSKKDPKVTIARVSPDITVHPTEGDASKRVRLSRWMDRARANATTVTEVPPAARVDC